LLSQSNFSTKVDTGFVKKRAEAIKTQNLIEYKPDPKKVSIKDQLEGFKKLVYH